MPPDQGGEGSSGEELLASRRRPVAKGNGDARRHGKESLARLIWAENRPVRLELAGLMVG